MSNTSNTVNLMTEAAKSAPPVAVSGVMLTSGPSLADQFSIAVSVLTAIYVLMQVFFLLRRESRARKAKRQDAPE